MTLKVTSGKEVATALGSSLFSVLQPWGGRVCVAGELCNFSPVQHMILNYTSHSTEVRENYLLNFKERSVQRILENCLLHFSKNVPVNVLNVLVMATVKVSPASEPPLLFTWLSRGKNRYGSPLCLRPMC